jgi:hypothetical protein
MPKILTTIKSYLLKDAFFHPKKVSFHPKKVFFNPKKVFFNPKKVSFNQQKVSFKFATSVFFFIFASRKQDKTF